MRSVTQFILFINEIFALPFDKRWLSLIVDGQFSVIQRLGAFKLHGEEVGRSKISVHRCEWGIKRQIVSRAYKTDDGSKIAGVVERRKRVIRKPGIPKRSGIRRKEVTESNREPFPYILVI